MQHGNIRLNLTTFSFQVLQPPTSFSSNLINNLLAFIFPPIASMGLVYLPTFTIKIQPFMYR